MDYLTDGSHVLISGATGAGDTYGGKSVLANWWYDNSVRQGWHSLGVFYNPKGLSYVRGVTVRGLDDLARHYREGARLFDFRPDSNYGADEHKPLIDMLRELPGSKIVVHDEAQGYSDSDGLAWCLSQGGNLGSSEATSDSIRSMLVTQRPWNLPERMRAEAPLKIWVGPATSEGERFFSVENMKPAYERVKDNSGKYRWSVTNAGEFVETNQPVPEEYAE